MRGAFLRHGSGSTTDRFVPVRNIIMSQPGTLFACLVICLFVCLSVRSLQTPDWMEFPSAGEPRYDMR